MLIQIMRGLLRASFRIVVVVLVLASLYLVLGRAFVYSVASDKQSIESFLHTIGLQSVAIGHAEGDWKISDPVFILSDVRLSRGAEEVLRLASLRIRFDSYRSLISGLPIIAEIEARGVNFNVLFDGHGARVKGLAHFEGDSKSNWLLDTIPHLDRVVLNDVDIAVQGLKHQTYIRSREGEPWQIIEKSEIKSVSLPIYTVIEGQTEARENRLNLTGQYSGDIRADDFYLKLYLAISTINIGDYLTDFRIGNHLITTSNLSSEIWIEANPSQVIITGDARLSSVLSQRGTLLDQGNLQFRYEGPNFSVGSLSIPMIELIQDDMHYRLANISGALEVGSESLAIAGEVPVVDLKKLGELLQFAGKKQLLPEKFSAALNDLNPRGELQNVNFLIDGSKGQPLMVCRLVDLSIDSYSGIPAIEPLNGVLMAQPSRGYLDIDSGSFSVNFSNMFAEPWSFDSGKGRLTFELSEGEVRLESGLIELVQGELEAYGKAVVNLPLDRELHSWGLTLGINDAALLNSQKFLPKTMSKDMVNWLKASVRAGVSRKTGLTFHGSLFRGSSKVRKAHDLFFKVSDSNLKYHVDWPPITQVQGTVHINNHFVRSSNLIGKAFETSFEKADLYIPLDVNGRADTVFIEASSFGPFSDLIRTLNETPLSEPTANAAEFWKSSGNLFADMQLNVPIGDRTGQGVAVKVNAHFEDAYLRLPEFDLSVTELNGIGEFSTQNGLSVSTFTGVSFQEPIEGKIVSNTYESSGEIEITLNGKISSSSLYEWADLFWLSRADGVFDYTAVVNVPYGNSSEGVYIEANSNLVGVSIDLPYPLGKKEVNESRQFEYGQRVMEDEDLIDIIIGENLQASLRVSDGLAVGGRIHFGDEPIGNVSYDHVRLSGRLDYLDVEDWLTAFGELGKVTDVFQDNRFSEHVESAVLSIDNLFFHQLELEASKTVLVREDSVWLTSIENEMLKGELRVADNEDLPIEINLDRIRIDDSKALDFSISEVRPWDIDDINFSTASLVIGNEDYGSWSFRYSFNDQVARFEDVEASVPGLRVMPSSKIEWRATNGFNSSSFVGEIQVDDLAIWMQKFGFASSIEGQGLKLEADIVWPGSPFTLDFERLVGSFSIGEGKGRFVQAETSGALRLLGIFDFASIARRLRLDFSDVVEKGFEFSSIAGSATIDGGHLGLTEPIAIEGSAGRFTIGGDFDLKSGALNNEMIVTLPVSRTLPWYAAYSTIAAGPLSGVGVMIAQRVFENQINQMSSAKYKISGTIDEPNIEFVSIFDDKLAKSRIEQNEIQP